MALFVSNSMRRLAYAALAAAVPLAAAPAALAQSSGGDKPAGGAAIGEVVGATVGALLLTALLFYLGYSHRKGRGKTLKRLAELSAKTSGLPTWAALPITLATISLVIALFGMYWDISLHIDKGRDSGPLANPAHYFILVGLFGIFAAGFFALVLPEEKPSESSVRISGDWWAPVGGIVLMATSAFALLGFPLDDVWHRLFGQDVTLWGPTHLMMIGGAGLSLLGHATLLAEAGRAPEREAKRKGGFLSLIIRTRYAAVFGGLLIGLSTFQAEFDFGVPQFQLIFQPILIALAAGVALVGARIYGGRGGALIALLYFWAIRGVVSLLVGPVLGETTPHLPLYAAEAALVELLALRVSTTERPYRFGAIGGLLIGTLGLAAEWGWSHLWMPYPWPESLLSEALVLGPIAGIAGGLMGAFVGTTLAAPRRAHPLPAPAIAPAAAGLAVVALLIAYGLATTTGDPARANVSLTNAKSGPEREVNATVRLDPPDAADDSKWLAITAWQGDGLVVNRLEETGEGTYRTTEPIPVYGNWKALLRLHEGRSMEALPIFLPEDPAIPAKEVPATATFQREFGEERVLLQRERKQDVGAALYPAGSIVVGLIALSLIFLLGWALARVARAAAPPEPPTRPEATRAPRAVAPGAAS